MNMIIITILVIANILFCYFSSSVLFLCKIDFIIIIIIIIIIVIIICFITTINSMGQGS